MVDIVAPISVDRAIQYTCNLPEKIGCFSLGSTVKLTEDWDGMQ